jgi:Recombinase-like helix-turn-helix domain
MTVGYPEAANIVWQTREGVELTEFEIALGEALEAVFASEIYELDDIVDRFNQMDFRNREGETWTAESFEAELKRLGQ